VTAAGALYVWKFTRSIHIQVAPIDLNIGKLLMDPIDSFRDFVGSGGKPAWSPDGKYLAYRSCIGKCSRTTIKIRTMDTRQVRELQPVRLAYLQAQTDLTWSSDGRSLIVLATDLNGRRGNYRIDVQTGETSPVSGGAGPLENVTLDGTKMYVAVGGSIVEREASSGKERIVFQERAPGNRLLFSSSSDRRYTAIIETDSTRMSTLFVMPYGGGQPRELLRARALGEFGRNGMIWTLDNRAIVLMKANGQGKDLWLVPVIDGAPRKLDIDVGNWQVGDRNGGFKLRPDGRQIAFSAGEDKEEVWAIENFLPVPTARR
jgi:hypothetical protein